MIRISVLEQVLEFSGGWRGRVFMKIIQIWQGGRSLKIGCCFNTVGLLKIVKKQKSLKNWRPLLQRLKQDFLATPLLDYWNLLSSRYWMRELQARSHVSLFSSDQSMHGSTNCPYVLRTGQEWRRGGRFSSLSVKENRGLRKTKKGFNLTKPLRFVGP